MSIHLWYLSMFFILMLFTPFINFVLISKDAHKRLLIGATVAAILIFFLNRISPFIFEITDYQVNIVSWSQNFPYYVFYFISGFYLKRIQALDKSYIKDSTNSTILVHFLIVLIAMAAISNYYLCSRLDIVRDNVILGVNNLPTLLMTLSIFCLSIKQSHRLKPYPFISWISDASFGIYLVHIACIYTIHHYISPSFFLEDHIFIGIPLKILLVYIFSFTIIFIARQIRFRQIKPAKYIC